MLPYAMRGDSGASDQALQSDFDRARRKAVLRDLAAVVSRRPNRLIPFHKARREAAPSAERDLGVRSVPITRVVGSVDRFDDFDRAFLPRGRHVATRWRRVARAYADGLPLPAVELYQIGDAYFVKDGHHRVSVARLNGQEYIDAAVTEAVGRTLNCSGGCRRDGLSPRLTAGLRALVPALGRLRPPVPAGIGRCARPATPCLCA